MCEVSSRCSLSSIWRVGGGQCRWTRHHTDRLKEGRKCIFYLRDALRYKVRLGAHFGSCNSVAAAAFSRRPFGPREKDAGRLRKKRTVQVAAVRTATRSAADDVVAVPLAAAGSSSPASPSDERHGTCTACFRNSVSQARDGAQQTWTAPMVVAALTHSPPIVSKIGSARSTPSGMLSKLRWRRAFF